MRTCHFQPLTRRPLGGLGLKHDRVLAAVLCVLVSLCGCEIYGGKLYWAGKGPRLNGEVYLRARRSRIRFLREG